MFAYVSDATADIVIAGYDANANNRFSNNSGFILNGRNLSGVGLTNGGGFDGVVGIWATLISRNVVIAANHNQPNAPIFFFPNNDPGSSALTYSVVSSQKMRIGTTDLWLGMLDSLVDASTSHYAFATEFLTGPVTAPNATVVLAGSFQGDNGYVFGISPSNNVATQDQAVGRNIITGYVEDLPFLDGTADLLVLNRDVSNPAGFEAQVFPGDSGAPFFIERNGSLLLLGINSALFGTIADPTGTGVSYIGNGAIQIQAFINASAVPEPSVLLLVGLPAGLLAMRRISKRKLS